MLHLELPYSHNVEASIADPYKTEDKPKTKVETDPNKISHIIDMWKKEAAL